jgi:hypothetical protein
MRGGGVYEIMNFWRICMRWQCKKSKYQSNAKLFVGLWSM